MTRQNCQTPSPPFLHFYCSACSNGGQQLASTCFFPHPSFFPWINLFRLGEHTEGKNGPSVIATPCGSQLLFPLVLFITSSFTNYNYISIMDSKHEVAKAMLSIGNFQRPQCYKGNPERYCFRQSDSRLI